MSVNRLMIEPLRSAFAHEAYNFSAWLQANIDDLANRIGIELLDAQREVRVGDFCVDIQCTDGSGHPVIIENQLEKTNHDHLGKLLVYMVNLDAKTAIWIASDAREEHRRVVSWLNEMTPADLSFYLVTVEAARIGDSPYAPLFTVVARPDNQIKRVGAEKKEIADSNLRKHRFWTSLIGQCKERVRNRFASRTPSDGGSMDVGAGLSGVAFYFAARNDHVQIGVWIDNDKRPGGENNKKLFDLLRANQDAIESSYGSQLNWDRMDGNRASKIWHVAVTQGLANEDDWVATQIKAIEAMEKFDEVMRPRVESAKKSLRLVDALEVDN
jgi:hypothetical protein